MDVVAANTALNSLVGLTTRALARSLLERVLGYAPLPRAPNDRPDTEEGSASDHGDVLDELTAALAPTQINSIELSRSERREAIDEAWGLLREVGLDEAA